MKTEVIRNMSTMVGKMDEFKKLVVDTYNTMNSALLTEHDDLASLYEDLDIINKTKIDVDAENISAEEDYITTINGKPDDILGFHEVNGFPFYGFNLGGDWEEPLFGCIVSDGKGLFNYIPLSGNNFNETELAAYGNNDDNDDSVDVDICEIEEDIIKAFVIPS